MSIKLPGLDYEPKLKNATKEKVTNEMKKNFTNSKEINRNFLTENPLPINQVERTNIIRIPIIIPGENREPNCLLALMYNVTPIFLQSNPLMNIFSILYSLFLITLLVHF